MTINPNKTFVILVGVENYDDKELHALPAASSNVLDLYRLFTNKVGIPGSNIYRIIDLNKSTDFFEEIEEKVGPEFNWELIIFYYSGHGVKSDDQTQYYLATKSIKSSRPATVGISLEQLIKDWLNTTKLLIVLDCCFSGKAFDFAQGKYDYYFMASSAYKETSKYPLNENNSAFTSAMIEVMANGTGNDKEYLTIEDVFDGTKHKLEELKFSKPVRLSKGELGELEIVKNSFQKKEESGMQQQRSMEVDEAAVLFRKIRFYDPTIAEDKQRLDARSVSFSSQLNKSILNRYPYPVAYFLKSLLGNHNETSEIAFYQSLYSQVIKFLAFLLIEDLVDNRNAYEIGKLFNLDLADIRPEACLEILQTGCSKFGGKLFIKEFTAKQDFLVSAANLQKALDDQPGISISELRKMTVVFIGDVSFLSRYELLAIRNIIVQKSYCPPKIFRHETCKLMGETINNYIRDIVIEDDCLHNGTILFFRKNYSGSIGAKDEYLNLWPLIVDANGFKEGSEKPDVYLFSKIDIAEEFNYEVVSLRSTEMESLSYTDINEFISFEEKERFFEAFLLRLNNFFK